MKNESREWLYKTLSGNGYNVGKDYAQFDSLMTNNADSRKWVYETMRSNGYNVGKDYNEFEGLVNPVQATEQPTGVVNRFKDKVSAIKDKAEQVANQPTVHVGGDGMTFTESQLDSIDNGAKPVYVGNQPVQQPKQAVQQTEPRRTLRTPQELKEELRQINPDVADKAEALERTERETRAFAPTHLVEDYNRTAEETNKELTEAFKRGAFRRPTLDDELEAAYRDKARLEEEISANAGPGGASKGWATKMSQASNGSPIDVNTADEDRRAALRQVENRIQTLEDEKNNAGFWRGLSGDLFKPQNWSFGIVDLADATRLRNAVGAGDKVTDTQKELLRNTLLANDAESRYGRNRNAWYRAGKMGALSIQMMPDFMLGMGGMKSAARTGINLATKAGVKALGEKAMQKGLIKYTTKALGLAGGSLAGGARMVNTIQLPRLGAEAMKNYNGNLVQDENGKYKFEDGEENFLDAVLKAEQTLIPEAASEVGGEFTPGVGRILGGLGMKKIAKGLSAVQGTKLYKNVSKALAKTGFNGAPSEAFEEYANDVYSMMLGDKSGIFGENGQGGWGEGQKHLDIWLGTGTLGALLHAPTIAGTGFGAAQYYRYKHKTNTADKNAKELLGAMTWDNIKKSIDNSTNDNISDVVTAIFKAGGLDREGKKAVIDYAGNLQKQRGFSLGLTAAKNEEGRGKEGATADVLDNSYGAGYEAEGREQKEGIKATFDAATQNLDAMGEDIASMVKDEENPPMAVLSYMMGHRDSYSDEQISAAADYYQAKMQLQGMEQAEADNAEIEGEQTPKPLYTTVEQSDGKFNVSSFDKNGNLLGQQSFDTEDEANAYRGEVKMQKEHQDLQDYIGRMGAQGANTIAQFEQENGWEPGTIQKLTEADPMQMSDEELQMADQARAFLQEQAYPPTEVHIGHSEEQGAEAADDADIDTDTPNAEVVASVVVPYVESRDKLSDLFKRNEELAEEVQLYEQMGKSEQEIVSMLDTFKPEDVQTVIDYYNAQARLDGFMNRSKEKIEERVRLERGRRTFKGVINGQPDVRDLVEITDGENTYTLVNGNIRTNEQGQVTGSDGVIIALDQNGNFVSLGGNSTLSVLPSETTLDNWEEAYRNQVQENATASIDPNGVLQETTDNGQPTTEEPIENGEQAGGEAGQTTTGANEPSAPPAPQENQPITIESVTGEDGVKRYEQGVDVDTAIKDMEADGLDVNEWSDLAINEAQEELNKMKAPKTRAEYVKNAQRKNELQATIDYYNNVKNRYTELHPVYADAAPFVERLNKATSKKNADDILNEALQAGVNPSEIQAAHTQKVSDIITKEEEARQRAEEITDTDKKNIAQYGGTPEGRASLLDKKRGSAEKRRKLAKEIYGEYFDDDFEAIRDLRELISSWLGKGRALDPDTFGQELGWDMGVGKDAAKVSTMFTKRRENGGDGMTFNDFVHMVWEASGGRFDTDEIRNELLDMFQGAQDKTDLTEYQLQSRIAEAEMRMQGELERAEQAAQEGETEQAPIGDGMLPFAPMEGEEAPVAPSEQLKPTDLRDNVKPESAKIGESKKELQEKIKGWLTDENVEWAEGKDLNEVIERFGNEPEPIAVMPEIVRKNIPSLDTDYLYCGKAYFIDHHANHHPELDIDEYDNIQEILDSYDDIKDLSDGGNLRIAFVKKLDKGYAVVAELSKENDKIVLHKTFFYRDAAGKRIPYKNKPSILEKWSVDGSTTISPVESQQPADTENISALDQSSEGKDTNESEEKQEKVEKSSSKQDYLTSHPLTEEQIMADAESTEDEKLAAVDYLKGEDDSAISQFYYDEIYRRATQTEEQKDKEVEDKSERTGKTFNLDDVEALKSAPSGVRGAIKDYAVSAYNSAYLKVPSFQFGIPEEQQENMTYEKFLDEFKEQAGVLARGCEKYLPAVYEYIESKLDKRGLNHQKYAQPIETENPTEAIEQAAKSFRQQQKAQDRADIDAALKEFNDFLDGAKGNTLLGKLMYKGLEGNDKAKLDLTVLNAAQRAFMKDLLRLASKVGYAYIKSGVHNVQAWSKQMSESIGKKLKEVLGWDEATIDDFIGEVWEQKYTVDGERMKLREHAEKLNKNKEADQTVNVNKQKNNGTENVVSLQQEAEAEPQPAEKGLQVDFDEIESLKKAPFSVRETIKDNAIWAYQDAVISNLGSIFGFTHEEREEKKYNSFVENFNRRAGDLLSKGCEPYLRDVYDYISKKIGEQLERRKAEKEAEVATESQQTGKLEGDSAEFAKEQKKKSELGVAIFSALRAAVFDGDVQLKTMQNVKALAKEYGLENLSSTDLQEMVEAEVVQLARRIAEHKKWTPEQKYENIVRLYQTQPSLNARDNDRINLQQYSTPAPMAYLMGRFVDPNDEAQSGLEPSAGNGMLTIGLPKDIMHVNDIDEMRLSNLAKQGFKEVTSQDGTLPFGDKKYDVIVTNPPFGSTEPKVYDLYSISGLEHQMAINALDAMKDDGRAAIIIGGNTEYTNTGVIKGKDRSFLNYLYSHYNVVDVINMDGKSLYSRQGTGFPVRMILINGRKEFEPNTFAPVQSKARAEQIKTYDELYKRVNDDILSDNNKPAGVHDTESGEGGRVDDTRHAGASAQTGVRNVRTEGGEGQPSVRAELRPSVQGGDNATERTDAAEQQEVDRGLPDVGGRSGANEPSGSAPAPANGEGGNVSERGNDTERPAAESGEPSGGGRSPRVDDTHRVLGAEKVPYRPQSNNPYSLQSQMPAEQADVVKKALEDLGDVDEFLVRELGYSSVEDLYHGSQSPEKHGGLAAEQIDSVAMAIHQMNQGNAFIIGDQTGIGKGRQAAALIRYGVKKGGFPVFITVKKALFSDMYRDLCDIGSPKLKPFIWSADDSEHSGNVTDKDGKVIYEMPSKSEQKRVVDYINKYGKLPKEYDYVLTTYDAFKSGTMDYENGQKKARKFAKGKTAGPVHINGQAKRDALERLAENSYVIMDESHNAGGEGSNISNYLQYITTRAKGITFLSATFAKRPGNMPIYSLKTAIAKAGVEVADLIDAVKRGGATFQEIMSKALTEAGQMIRRERDMTGVTIDWRGIEDEQVIEKQRQQYDEIIGLFNDIIDFQRTYVDPIIDKLNDDAADAQGAVDHTPGTRDMGINNTPFASRTYNMVQQVLLSLKAEEAAKRAIEHLKEERKAVITVANTNEGAADEVSAANGESMEMPDLSVNLKKGLRGTLRITRKDGYGDSKNSEIPFGSLSPEGQARYQEIMDAIDNASTGLSLSPIDVIKNELKKAGYKVGELTGRKAEFVYNEDGSVKRVNRKDTDKKKVAADFNNGKLDALILNKSAGTGISLHASTTFKDQHQRIMIVAQAQGDVNDEVQIRGRIDRTGQVQRGAYEYVVSQIPSEQRLLMMLKAKLRSLDANTTSSQKSKFNEMQVQDIINKYGDQIVIQYLAEHVDLAEKMQNPLKWDGDWQTNTPEQLVNTASKADTDGGTASKVLGRMALLKVKEQEQMLDDISSLYQAEIDRLNDMGENDLEITEMPLKAKTLSKQVWEQGIEPGGKNPFADNSYVEKVNMDVLRKPMKGSEVKAAQERLLGGKTWDEYKQSVLDKLDKWAEDKKSDTTETITARAEKKAEAEKEKYIKGAKKAQEKNGMTDAEIEKNGQLQYDTFYKQEMEKLNNALAAIEKQKDVFVDALETFTTDGVYALPSNIYDLGRMTFEPGFGKLIDMKIADNFSTSASTISFATLDGRRKITIPISGMVKQQNNEKRGIFPIINTLTAQTRHGMFGQNMSNTLKVLGQNLDNWDKLTSTAARKDGYIITGNLLKALVSTREQHVGGKLISYTADTGEVRQGILMPDNFEPAGLTSKTPISAKKDELRYSRDKVESADGDVSIRVTNDYDWREHAYNTLELTVPKSVKKGAKYFNDQTLLDLMQGQFEGSSRMKAEFKRENLDAVMKRLDELGVTVQEQNNNDTDRRFDEDIEDAYTAEEQSIIDEAKKNGTYMKAPNGKKSNLTPKQWVRVRTKAFKDWFGDWLKGAQAVTVVNTSLEHGFKNFADARQWAKKNIARVYTNEETGGKGEIRISGNAIEKFTSEDAVKKSDNKDVHMAVLKVLPSVIKEGVDADTHPDYIKIDGVRKPENGVNPGVTIHRVYGGVEIDGKIYRVKVTLKEDRTQEIKKRAYSYEATKIELMDGQSATPVGVPRNSNNSILLANLLKNIDKSYTNGEKIIDSSQIIDENGEPKVVYHGSRSNNISVFDNSKAEARHSGSTLSKHSDRTHFFTDSEDAADASYAKGITGTVYPVFLNIRNPKVVDNKGARWDGTGYVLQKKSRITNGWRRVYPKNGNLDYFTNGDHINKDGHTNYRDDSEYKYELVNVTEPTDVIVEKAILDEQQYDGVIIKNVVDASSNYDEPVIADDFVTFVSPNQIKSATENNGDYSNENPGIRFDQGVAEARQQSDSKQRIAQHIDSLVKKLGTKAKTTVYHSLSELPADARRHVEDAHKRGRKVRGWYENGRVYLFLPDIDSTYQAEKTIWHETVAHHGLRELIGAKNYNELLKRLWLEHKDGDMGEWVTKRMEQNGWSLAEAIDEYLAREAEKEPFKEPSLWKRLQWMLTEILHKMGFTSDPTITDIQYLFWVSQNQIRENDPMTKMKQAAFLFRLEREVPDTPYVNMMARKVEDIYNPEALDAYDDGRRHSEETDEEVIERLEKEPKVKAYRAMQLIDGKLYPPMAAKQGGKLVAPIELGKWERADEHPEMADENGKFKLDKGNGKTLKAAYNPYIHTSTTMLNDQFSEAQSRPNLVVVEVEVPESELTSGYKAEKAKDSVGKVDWKAGVIQGQLSGTREVILSRWDKPVRIVPVEEVAKHIADMVKDRVEVMPTNVVTPQQREEMEKLGVKFVETDNRGMLVDGENKGKSYSSVYGKKAERRYDEDIDDPMEESVKDMYNERTDTAQFVMTEAYQDSMLALKTAQNAIVKDGDIPDSQNAYQAENLMHGKSKNEQDLFNVNFRDPLVKTTNKILNKMGWTMRRMNQYLITKSGLERNRELFVRDWLEKERKRRVTKEENLNDAEHAIYERIVRAIEDDFEDGNITEEQKNARLASAVNDAHLEHIENVEIGWQAMKSRWNNPNYTFAEYMNDLTQYIQGTIDEDYDPSKNDYSGLTEIYGGQFDDVEATNDVMNDETAMEADAEMLWRQINEANKYGLERYREAGMRSDEEIDRIERMFHWYVPLRGFDKETAEDVYQYFTSKQKANSYVGGLIKRAKGRKSQAKSPMATMFAMAYKAIGDCNQNLVNQHLYRLCQAHPNDLVIISDAWARLNQTTGMWEESYPTIPDNATDEEIRQITLAWEQENKRLELQGEARRINGKGKFDYKFADKKSRDEHIVEVMINGKKKLMTVVGNPRMAQALNGQTRFSNAKNFLSSWNSRIKHMMSSAYTSYNPTFAMRNLMRDWTHFRMMLGVREGQGYARAANKYYRETFPRPIHTRGKEGMKTLFKKYRDGTLDMNKEVEKDFKDFMDNGGITGFVQMQKLEDIEKHMNNLNKQLKAGKTIKLNNKIWDMTLGVVEAYNEAIENNARFATYRASRHYAGRTKARSAYDAKEVTVNFNRKGAGAKTAGFKSKRDRVTHAAQVAGVTSQVLGEGRIFNNATIQAIATTFKNFQNPDGSINKGYVARWAKGYAIPPFVLGFVMPYINGALFAMLGGSGDDDPYANLPDWVRRKNLCFYLGFDSFLTTPVAQELAAFLTLGDIAAGVTYAPELKPIDRGWEEELADVLNTFSPVDIDKKITNGGLFSKDWMLEIMGKTFSVLTPAISVAENRSWTGRPIFREDRYENDIYTPEYQMVYRDTNPILVEASKWLNDISGGDEDKRGWIQVNPAIVQYLFEQFTGGPGKTLSNFISIGRDIKDLLKEGSAGDFNARKVEGLKAFVQQGDDRTQYYRTLAKYRKYGEDAKELKDEVSRKMKRAEDGDVDALLKLQEIDKSVEAERMRIYYDYEKDLRKLYSMMLSTEDKALKKELQKDYNEAVKEVVDLLDDVKAME